MPSIKLIYERAVAAKRLSKRVEGHAGFEDYAADHGELRDGMVIVVVRTPQKYGSKR